MNYFFFSYQNGPDTYLLQLRDTDFPVRLREYMKVAAQVRPGRTLGDSDYDWRVRNKYRIKNFTIIIEFNFFCRLHPSMNVDDSLM